jgi:hypothetical protein
MSLDFEDYRPESPRLIAPISAREGVLISMLVHAVIFIAYLVTPKGFFQVAPIDRPMPPPDPVKFVYMEPRIDRSVMPIRPAEMSDLDRRSATRERAPIPQNTAPFSRGNTIEKTEGSPTTPPDKAAGAELPAPPSPSTTPPPEAASKIPTTTPTPAPGGGQLGQSLKNLQQYLRGEQFNNQQGGQTDLDADIQFDAKGADFGPWLRRFRNQVKRNWLIPGAAEFIRGEEVVVAQFNVHRNGQITDLVQLSGASVPALTAAAINALRLSNPAPQLPADYPDDKVFFTVSFHYLRGRQVPAP